MATSMHRLQISLPKTQMQYLARRARREGASVAELLRRMIRREADAARSSSVDSLWEIVGIGIESRPLISGIPVSERPGLYLADIAAPKASPRAKKPRRRRMP